MKQSEPPSQRPGTTHVQRSTVTAPGDPAPGSPAARDPACGDPGWGNPANGNQPMTAMEAMTEAATLPAHLKALEAESIHILREVAAQAVRPVLLDRSARIPRSCCTWRARRSSRPAALPAAAHRHDLEVPRDDPPPRHHGAALRPGADRAYQRGGRAAEHQPVRPRQQPTP